MKKVMDTGRELLRVTERKKAVPHWTRNDSRVNVAVKRTGGGLTLIQKMFVMVSRNEKEERKG